MIGDPVKKVQHCKNNQHCVTHNSTTLFVFIHIVANKLYIRKGLKLFRKDKTMTLVHSHYIIQAQVQNIYPTTFQKSINHKIPESNRQNNPTCSNPFKANQIYPHTPTNKLATITSSINQNINPAQVQYQKPTEPTRPRK